MIDSTDPRFVSTDWLYYQLWHLAPGEVAELLAGLDVDRVRPYAMWGAIDILQERRLYLPRDFLLLVESRTLNIFGAIEGARILAIRGRDRGLLFSRRSVSSSRR